MESAEFEGKQTRTWRAKFTGPLADLTDQVIACALNVHRALGPGFVGSVYENAMALDLEEAGLSFERQKQMKVFYKGKQVGIHRLDLLVKDLVIVELKAKEAFCDADIATVLSYLKATGKPVALLLNFGAPQLQIKRLANTASRSFPRSPSPSA
jgi:GxxExxY protein